MNFQSFRSDFAFCLHFRAGAGLNGLKLFECHINLHLLGIVDSLVKVDLQLAAIHFRLDDLLDIFIGLYDHFFKIILGQDDFDTRADNYLIKSRYRTLLFDHLPISVDMGNAGSCR